MDPDSIRYQSEDMQIAKDEKGKITVSRRKVELEIRQTRQSKSWIGNALIWIGRIGVILLIFLL